MEDFQSLIARAQRGDREAYGQLVRRFQDMAYGYALSIVADFHRAQDAAQEAFIEAYRQLGQLRNPRAFPGWLRKIIFKHCDRMRRRKRVAAASLDETESPGAGPEVQVERREAVEQVLAAVNSLPEDERTATTLFYIDGYSYKDIAQFLDVPISTVTNRLRSSRARLRKRMTTMVADTLHQHALPDGFGAMVSRLVMFPDAEPPIEVARAEQRAGHVQFREGGGFFVPLTVGGEAIVSWYDWPERTLTATSCVRVVGKARVAGHDCLRVRMPDFDPDRRWIYDHEWYWAVRDCKVHFVAKSNFEPGADHPRLMTCEDRDWDEGRTGQPIELGLKSRIHWDSDGVGTGPRFPRTLAGGGLWTVCVGDTRFECLRALWLGYGGPRKGRAPSELAASYRVLAEYYIDMDGRTVLFRRHNGPAWKPEGSSVGSLRDRGCPGLKYNGVEFRLWYDCIPLRTIERASAADVR